MRTRLQLQSNLETALGSRNVYYQPPESLKLSYPCIVYELASENVNYANNELYSGKKRYTVTVIDKKADSPIPDRIRRFLYCSFDRAFVSDNLNHYVFSIYY